MRKVYIDISEVMPRMEKGQEIYLERPEGSSIKIDDLETAKYYLGSYLQHCLFYYEEEI